MAQTVAVGLKTAIKDLGIDRNSYYHALEQMAEDAFDDQCTGANPRYPLIADLKALFIAAFEGIDPKTLNI